MEPAGNSHNRLGPWLGLVLLAAVMSWGCAANQPGGQLAHGPGQAPSGHGVGFLSDYQKLRPVAGLQGAQSWRQEGTDWGKYDKVLIERMRVFIKEEGPRKGVDPTDLKMLTDYFHEALAKEVAKSATLVDKPGTGVLRVRVAIVDLVPTMPAVSAVGTATPYGFAAELASGVATGRPVGSAPYLGKTGIQAQFLDGATGQVVAEFTDTEMGRKYVAELDKGVPNAAEQWANGYIHSFTTWGYAKDAFDRWAKWFRESFDHLRGAQAKT